MHINEREKYDDDDDVDYFIIISCNNYALIAVLVFLIFKNLFIYINIE
jgi:hypothetical protein